MEAYHGGIIRTELYENKDVSSGYQGVTIANLAQLIANLRAKADGTLGTPGVDDQGIEIVSSPVNGTETEMADLVPVDANGLAFARSPSQVCKCSEHASGRQVYLSICIAQEQAITTANYSAIPLHEAEINDCTIS